MRTILAIVLLLSTVSVEAQSTKQLERNYWAFFSDFENQLEFIAEHWTENFKEDIYGTLTGESEGNYHSLMVDSYGGVYLEEEIYKGFSDKSFYGKGRKHLNLINNSHYGMFCCWDLPISDENAAFKELNKLMLNKDTRLSIPDFYEKWHELTVSKEVERIQTKLEGKKKVLFFAHGYNVPYSLAVVQAKALIDHLVAEGMDRNEVLLVPVFWPSNNQKKVDFDVPQRFLPVGYTDENEAKDQMEDQFKFLSKGRARIANKKGIRNAKRFTTYSNQAYFAGIELRRILSGLGGFVDSSEIDVMMFSHSLGATVLTTSLINTVYKLDYPDAYDFSMRLNNNMRSVEIPEFPIKVFMSAPAIPGVSTFTDMDISLMDNKLFYSTVNVNDKSLTKNFIPGFKFPSKLSATGLGCDHNFESGRTKLLFETKGLGENFVFKDVSDQSDHNMFSYLLQDGYLEFMDQFVLEKTPGN